MSKAIEFLKNISPLISAGVGIGSIISNSANTVAANEANVKLAKQQNAYNVEQWNRENAYNTPYAQMQRLKAAGLNPNLVFAGGSLQTLGASSPNMVSGVGSQVPYHVDPLTAAQIANLNAQTQKTKAETDTENTLRQATLDNIVSQTNLNNQSVKESIEKVVRLAKENQLTDAQIRQIDNSIDVALASLDNDRQRLAIEKNVSEAQVEQLRAGARKALAEAKVSERELKEMIKTFAFRMLDIQNDALLKGAQIKVANETAKQLGMENIINSPEAIFSQDFIDSMNGKNGNMAMLGAYIRAALYDILGGAGRVIGFK